MMRIVKALIIGTIGAALTLAALGPALNAGPPFRPAGTPALAPSERLVVLWTSGDRDVAMNMVFMYTLNAKLAGWWKDVTFIIWGPSARLLTEDAGLQAELAKMMKAGIVLETCIACAERYGVTGRLRELGVDVKGMGKPLTEYIKEGRTVLTF